MLVKIHIDPNISIKDLREIKEDLKENKIHVYKIYCDLSSDLIKLHLSDSSKNLEDIFKKYPLIKNFKKII
jgi:2-phosphoglycerate kinase